MKKYLKPQYFFQMVMKIRNVYGDPKTISDYPDGKLMFSGWNSNRLTNINKRH